MNAHGLDPTSFLRSEHVSADVHQVLRAPVTALAGVSQTAADALALIGVRTVFDLAASSVFALAQAAAEAGTVTSLPARIGVTPSDWLAPGTTFESPSDIPDLPLAALRGLPPETAAALTAALDVTSIRDFAAWPPRLVAKGLLAVAVGPVVDGGDAGAEALRPRLGEYPTERVYYDRLVMLHMEEDGDGESDGRRPARPARCR
jgi:hypothetical protein